MPPDKLNAALESIRKFGLEPLVYPSCSKRHGYLAGTDRERASDLTEAFASRAVEAVICIRGGYGAHRLLEYVDFDAIAASGKPLYGYSDITALHIEMNRRGVVSWHTPMPGKEWLTELDDFTLQSVKAALFGPMLKELKNPIGADEMKAITPGKAEGIICGGNLSLVAASLGTFYEIDTKGKIIFLEEVEEAPYRIDRMLLKLRHAGKFNDCSGIVFGAFTDCEPKDPKMSLTVKDIIIELTGDIKKPVVTGFQCGHVLPTACIPLGMRVLLDADNVALRVVG